MPPIHGKNFYAICSIPLGVILVLHIYLWHNIIDTVPRNINRPLAAFEVGLDPKDDFVFGTWGYCRRDGRDCVWGDYNTAVVLKDFVPKSTWDSPRDVLPTGKRQFRHAPAVGFAWTLMTLFFVPIPTFLLTLICMYVPRLHSSFSLAAGITMGLSIVSLALHFVLGLIALGFFSGGALKKPIKTEGIASGMGWDVGFAFLYGYAGIIPFGYMLGQFKADYLVWWDSDEAKNQRMEERERARKRTRAVVGEAPPSQDRAGQAGQEEAHVEMVGLLSTEERVRDEDVELEGDDAESAVTAEGNQEIADGKELQRRKALAELVGDMGIDGIRGLLNNIELEQSTLPPPAYERR